MAGDDEAEFDGVFAVRRPASDSWMCCYKSQAKRLNTIRPPALPRQDFWRFCQENPDWRLERDSDGAIRIKLPASLESGNRNHKLSVFLGIWARRDGTGECFDSSTGFELPNGAIRSPDAAWVSKERLSGMPKARRRAFPRLVPEFVAEIRSESDSLAGLEEKMIEYADNGVLPGWLIDPFEQRVHVYRAGRAPVIADKPKSVSGDPVLRGFRLPLRDIWHVGF